MKRILTYLIIVLGLGFVCAQSNNQNYILTTEYLDADGTDTKQAIQYFDGLGRPVQVIAVGQSAEETDIITHIEYDDFGRQTKDYLPVPVSQDNGNFIVDPSSAYNTYYNTSSGYETEVYYSEKELESSPLNRVFKQAAPGDDWALGSGNEIEFDYQTNTEGEVLIFTVGLDADYTPTLEVGETYENGQLYKTITRDENHQGNGSNGGGNPEPDPSGIYPLQSSFTGLEQGQTYTFKVKRICENGIESDWSDTFTIDAYTPATSCTAPTEKELIWERVSSRTGYINTVEKEYTYTLQATVVGMNYDTSGFTYADRQFGYHNEIMAIDYNYKFRVKKHCPDNTESGWAGDFILPNFVPDENSCADPLISNIGWKRISDTEVVFEQIDKGSQYFIEFTNNTPVGINNQARTGEDHTIEEFKNKEGQVVLKRTYENTVAHDTYYVYDIYGNLTYVIPPLVNTHATITQDILDELCYQYKYDHRNRLVEKKLPGKAWEYMVYDKQDRLVGTQDGNLRSTNLEITGKPAPASWLFTKYDKFGRVTYTGITGSFYDRASLQQTIDGFGANNTAGNTTFTQNGITVSYAKEGSWPESFTDLLTVNYYDNYGFAGAEAPTGQIQGQNVISATTTVTTKGLSTASFVRIIGTNLWEKTHNYYDNRSRVIRTKKYNHLGGYTQTDLELDFRGKVKKDIVYHKRTNADTELVVTNNYNYDHAERLTKQTFQVNNETVHVLANNVYDALGQLETKKVGGSASLNIPLQVVDYKYNIRGWLTDINDVEGLTQTNQPDDLFAFKINYNQITEPTDATALYNGNIAQTFWRTGTDNQLRGYNYRYDPLNRLRRAYYNNQDEYTGNFDEHITYDKNGNITTLNRWGTPEVDQKPVLPDIDHLQYSYYPNSNQLRSVNDATTSTTGFTDGAEVYTEYVYDANGNMIRDLNKKIGTANVNGIKYNYLNLPTEIKFQNSNNKKITYLYNALGQKVEKQVKTTASDIVKTEYLDGFQYRSEVLEFFPHAEGYVRLTQYDEKYWYDMVYNYTDHLGNIRLSYTKDPLLVQEGLNILEENNYYPFGLKHGLYNKVIKDYIGVPLDETREIVLVEKNPYNYKYNGKEFQDELNLNVYDYGNRNYQPDIGRFFNMDRFSEKYPNISTYAYTANSPTRYVDVRGDSLWITFGNKNQHRVLYQNGQLLNADGSQYQGEGVKVKKDGSIKIKNSFLKSTLNALGELSNSATGAEMIAVLEKSGYNFNITHGSFNTDGKQNSFVADNSANSKFFANLPRAIATNNLDLLTSIGSGGTIYWNPTDADIATLNTTQGSKFNATTNLGHELAHGWDSNFGLLDFSKRTSNGLSVLEGRASYIENQIRGELNIPLRTTYRQNGTEYRILDGANNPIPYGGISNPTMNFVSKVFSNFIR